MHITPVRGFLTGVMCDYLTASVPCQLDLRFADLFLNGLFLNGLFLDNLHAQQCSDFSMQLVRNFR